MIKKYGCKMSTAATITKVSQDKESPTPHKTKNQPIDSRLIIFTFCVTTNGFLF
jgi:hypothetical protein